MWLERSIGTCQEKVGLSQMGGGMTMLWTVTLKMNTANIYGTSVCEQTMKLGLHCRRPDLVITDKRN